MFYKLSSGTAIAAMLVAAGFSVSVQAAEPSLVIEEIVVTARKRQEAISDLPMSITAFSGDQLESMGAENFEDWAGHVPGLSFTQRDPAGADNEGPDLSVRGVNGKITGGDAPIGFYINETPVGSLNMKYIDVDHVEVLKGPQGTLYGGRAMGGLVKVVTNVASPEAFDLALTGDFSDTKEGGENYELSGMVNIPVIEDTLAIRAVAYSIQKDGYVDWVQRAYREPLPNPTANTRVVKNVNEESTQGARFSALYNATENFSVTLETIYEDVETDANPGWDRPLKPQYGELVNGGTTLESNEAELLNIALTLKWLIGENMTLTSNSSYTNYDTFAHVDAGYFAGFLGANFGLDLFGAESLFTSDAERDVYTQELRLSSDGDGRLRWLVGGLWQEYETTFNTFINVSGLAAGVNGVFGFPLLANDVVIDQASVNTQDEWGIFGEVYYDITDQLTLTLGLRYFDNELKLTDARTGFFAGAPQPDVTAAKDGINPKVGLAYQLGDETLLYGSYSQGFRRAGGNPTSLVVPACDAELAGLGFDSAPATYDSDELDAYELGFKTTFLESRGSIEAALFYNDWDDRQTNVILASCGATFGSNLSSAEIYGLEISGKLLLTERLSLGVNIGLQDAEVAEDSPGTGFSKGDPLPLAPDLQYVVSLNYERPIFGDMDGFVRVDYQYRDEMQESLSSSTLDDYSLVNLKVGITTEQYDVTLFADNVTDERGELANTSVLMIGQLNTDRVVTTRPRTIGLRLNWHL